MPRPGKGDGGAVSLPWSQVSPCVAEKSSPPKRQSPWPPGFLSLSSPHSPSLPPGVGPCGPEPERLARGESRVALRSRLRAGCGAVFLPLAYPATPREESPGWSCPLPAGFPRMCTWISIKGSECSGCPLPNRPGLWSEKGGRLLAGPLGMVPIHCSPGSVQTGLPSCSLPGAAGPKEGAGSTQSALTWSSEARTG